MPAGDAGAGTPSRTRTEARRKAVLALARTHPQLILLVAPKV
jgi:hypothetical protein